MLTSNQPSLGPLLGHDPAAVADQAVHQRDVRAVGLALDVVGLRHVARHEDVRFDSGRGGIGGHGAGGIARGGNRHLADAEFDAHRDGAGKAARFEGAGGIEALVLDPEVVGADARAQAPGAHQRRPAFAERDDRRFGRRQHGRIPPHVGGAAGDIAPQPAMADDVQIVADQQRTAAGAEIGNRRRIVFVAAQAAFQMGRFRHSSRSLTSGSRRLRRPRFYSTRMEETMMPRSRESASSGARARSRWKRSSSSPPGASSRT